jgi:hypothetical protein
LIPFPKSHFVEANFVPEVGVEDVASNKSPYHDSSGLYLRVSFHQRLSPFTFITRDATFSFTSTSARLLNGSTSVNPASFL